MEPDTSAPQQDDSYFDERVGMVVTRSGRAKWRRKLDEHRANRDVAALEALRDRLRLGPAAQA